MFVWPVARQYLERWILDCYCFQSLCYIMDLIYFYHFVNLLDAFFTVTDPSNGVRSVTGTSSISGMMIRFNKIFLHSSTDYVHQENSQNNELTSEFLQDSQSTSYKGIFERPKNKVWTKAVALPDSQKENGIVCPQELISCCFSQTFHGIFLFLWERRPI